MSAVVTTTKASAESAVKADAGKLGELDGRTRRANAIREQRRALILEAAVTVFSDSGYHRTRISDIIAAAGIARGTFYLYFESKNAIFLELLDDLLLELRRAVRGVDTDASAPAVPVQLLSSVKRALERVADNRALVRILLREAVGLDAVVDHKLAEFWDKMHAWMAEALDNGKAMKLVRPEVDVHIAAICILGSLRGVMERELMDPDATPDLDHLAYAILDIHARGVLTIFGG